MNTRILRMREVVQRIGLSRSTIYKLMENHEFPRPLKLGSQAIGWRDSDIETWIADRSRSLVGRPEPRSRKTPR